jgi:hypothetical protein
MPLDAPTLPQPVAAVPPSGTVSDTFPALLPEADPLAAQALLCRELSRLAAPVQSGHAALRAMLVLDPHAHRVGKRLRTAYAEGDARSRAFDPRYLISARLLSRSFAQAYERLLAHLQQVGVESSRSNLLVVTVQLFRHRQSELLLRLLRYKRHSAEQWRQLYTAYRFAQEHGFENDPLPPLGERDARGERSIHHHFVELLLLGAMDTGALSPRELLWASEWLPDWSRMLKLEPVDATKALSRIDQGFGVDLSGMDGLARLEAGVAADLFLDTTALMSTIDDEIADLNQSGDDEPARPSAARDAAIALLSKLRILYSPEPVQFTRRGERVFVSTSVQSMCGLKHVVRIIREEAQSRGGNTRPRSRDAITISPGGGAADSFPGTVFHAAAPAPLTISSPTIRAPGAWQARDWSDSGCRLRGRASDLNEVIPGSLMTIREHQDAPWTVALVRRLRRLMVDHVEISLEFIGRKPRYVKLLMASDSLPVAPSDAPPKRKAFGAIYLPLSEKRPTLPIKTLVVPVAAYEPGRTVTLLASEARYWLRFNKALEHHADFVWTTFTLTAKR